MEAIPIGGKKRDEPTRLDKAADMVRKAFATSEFGEALVETLMALKDVSGKTESLRGEVVAHADSAKKVADVDAKVEALEIQVGSEKLKGLSALKRAVEIAGELPHAVSEAVQHLFARDVVETDPDTLETKSVSKNGADAIKHLFSEVRSLRLSVNRLLGQEKTDKTDALRAEIREAFESLDLKIQTIASEAGISDPDVLADLEAPSFPKK